MPPPLKNPGSTPLKVVVFQVGTNSRVWFFTGAVCFCFCISRIMLLLSIKSGPNLLDWEKMYTHIRHYDRSLFLLVWGWGGGGGGGE